MCGGHESQINGRLSVDDNRKWLLSHPIIPLSRSSNDETYSPRPGHPYEVQSWESGDLRVPVPQEATAVRPGLGHMEDLVLRICMRGGKLAAWAISSS